MHNSNVYKQSYASVLLEIDPTVCPTTTTTTTTTTILTQFLSNRSQQVMVDGCRSKLVNAVSGVPQDSVLCPLLFLLSTSELFSILENKLIGYADDSTLMAVVPSPGVRVAVADP